jgi:hypothetical protein
MCGPEHPNRSRGSVTCIIKANGSESGPKSELVKLYLKLFYISAAVKNLIESAWHEFWNIHLTEQHRISNIKSYLVSCSTNCK